MSGASNSAAGGTSITCWAFDAMSLSPWWTIAITWPSRALTSSMFPSIRSYEASRGDGDDGEAVGDQRDGPVLHLAAGVALGVDVRDLLQLQRALEGDGVLDAAAEIEEVGGVAEMAGQGGDLGVELQRLLDQARDLHQVPDALAHVLGGDRIALPAEPQAKQVHGHDHRGERLRRRHADL